MKELRINFKSFEKSIRAFYFKRMRENRFPNIDNIIDIKVEEVEDIINNLIKNYKRKPFWNYSAYNIELNEDSKTKTRFRVSYEFVNDEKLIFKFLFKRTGMTRNIRITQLVCFLKPKHYEQK